MACTDECVSERDCRKFEESLRKDFIIKKKFWERVEVKKYLHRVSDAGTRLLLPSALARGKSILGIYVRTFSHLRRRRRLDVYARARIQYI